MNYETTTEKTNHNFEPNLTKFVNRAFTHKMDVVIIACIFIC